MSLRNDQPRPQSNYEKVAMELQDIEGTLYFIWFENCKKWKIVHTIF